MSEHFGEAGSTFVMSRHNEDSRRLRVADVNTDLRFASVSTDQDPLSRAEDSDQSDLENDLWSFDELFTRPGKEAHIRPLPTSVPLKPSDREAHRKVIEQSYRLAHILVAAETRTSMLQGRCCLVGLGIVQLTRIVAWCENLLPGRAVYGIHWLTTVSDAVSLLSTLPFFIQGTRGKCVMFGCVGPMVTLVFSMCLADAGALIAYLAIARPQPLSEDASSRSLYDVMQALIGAWEFLLFASVALQLTLCACCWRIYRELRVIGLYPPGGRPLANASKVEVSYFEIVCEAEDAKRFNKNMQNCESEDVCCQTRLLAPEGGGSVRVKEIELAHPPVGLPSDTVASPHNGASGWDADATPDGEADPGYL